MGTSTIRKSNGVCGRREASFTPIGLLSVVPIIPVLRAVAKAGLLRRAQWCFCIVALLAAQPAFADGPREFLIRNWTREDGVPGNTVTAVAQTPEGYLWVGTLNGLARFDGVRFVGVDLQKLAGLNDPAVFFLQTDHAGNLWIGTMDGHLVRYDRGAVTSYVPPSHETSERFIRWIAEDKAGGLWSLNGEGALNRLTGGVFAKEADSPDIIALNSDAAGKVWAAEGSELLVSDAGHLTRTWDASEEPGFKPECLAPARDGGCWVAGSGSVRRFMDNELRETRPMPPGDPAALSELLEDGEGSLWLARYGGGITVLDKGGGLKRLTREEGLRSNLVRGLFEDREGNIWAGLEGKGLVRIRRATFASYGRAEGLSDETVLCVCEGNDGEVWIGTNGDGVYRIKNGQIRHYGPKDGLGNEFVWALHQDRTGRLWAGTWGGGLFRLEGEHFVDTARELGPKQVVLALHEDARGRLWLGQRIGPERIIESVEQGRLRSFSVPGSLPRLDVRAIAETKDGSVWFATMEEGLFRWKDGEFTRCGKDQGLPSGSISALHVDDDGDLWAAVPGVGLVLGDKDRFTPIAGTDGLVGENLSQITDDGLGYLWCGTRNGVVRIKKAILHALARGEHPPLVWQRFSNADGLPSNECSGSGCRTRDGRIWFPTLSGVAAVDPRSLRVNPAIMPVLIEDLLVGGKSMTAASDKLPGRGDAIQTAAGGNPSASGQHPQPLKIQPGQGQLSIAYTALSFTAPDRVQFRYQLLGLDPSPVEAGSARVVRYSYLPPGNYKFQVTACNEDGVWNEHWAGLAFEVLPHYWQTWWFRVVTIAVMLATTAGAVRWAIKRRLRQRMEALEREHAVEVERSRIAQDLHDDLGTSLTEISFLCAVAGSPSGSPAEVKGSLESITEKSLELVKALDEIVWAVNPKNDSLRNLVNYVCLFAQDFLRPASIQCRLDVPQGLPDFPVNAEQRHTIFLVTKEALANAAKHSGAAEVWLRVRFEASLLTLVVEDNGHGFDAAALKPGRNGMHNIETRMQHLGGRGVVRSGHPRGTRVEMQLRLG